MLVAGMLIGVVFTALWVSMRTSWQKSKDLRSASAKARKEMQEKSLKARVDAQKSRGALWRASLRVFFLVVAIVVTSWLLWNFILLT